jgi:DNA polymerase III epsilon subunit-like protein
MFFDGNDMKYVSIDIETTGLPSESCQILEIGAVMDDLSESFDPQPREIFHRYVQHSEYHGQPYALAMNQDILYTLAKGEHPDISWACDISAEFAEWLYLRGQFRPGIKVTVAGKNFAGFDKPFLKMFPKFTELINLHHRSIDPGTLWMKPTDSEIPSTEECMRRAGLEGVVAHTAVEDAIVVCKLIRRKWGLLCDR